MHRSSDWIDNIILWTLIILIRDQRLCDPNEMSQIRFYFSWAYELLDSTSGGRFPWQNVVGILCYEVNYNRVNSIGVMTNANRVVPNRAHLAQLEVRTHTVKKREERRACPWACHSAQTDFHSLNKPSRVPSSLSLQAHGRHLFGKASDIAWTSQKNVLTVLRAPFACEPFVGCGWRTSITSKGNCTVRGLSGWQVHWPVYLETTCDFFSAHTFVGRTCFYVVSINTIKCYVQLNRRYEACVCYWFDLSPIKAERWISSTNKLAGHVWLTLPHGSGIVLFIQVEKTLFLPNLNV